MRLQEIGTASLKNFVTATRNWFQRDLTDFNFYLMPLSFVALPTQTEAVAPRYQCGGTPVAYSMASAPA